MTATERRLADEYARKRGLSKRRSSRLLSLCDSSRRYIAQQKSPARKAAETAIIELSTKYPRYGYRFLGAMLNAAKRVWNHKFVYRVCRQHKLTVPRKRAYKRISGGQNRRMSAIVPNGIWAFDFVHDECANGQKLKCFAFKDEYTRESLAIDVSARYRARDVIACLERLIVLRGKPAILRCDNGPKFIALAVSRWAKNFDITVAFTDPGKPWQNGSIESFNSRFRDECLNMELSANRRQAQVLIEAWRRHYNEERPHSSIKYLTPTAMYEKAIASCQIRAASVHTVAA